MNWDYILSVTPRFIHATLMTLHLAFWGILLSLMIGVACAVITTYKVKSLTWLVKGYIELSRNTPLLIQVFFLYFGLSKIGLKLDGPSISRWKLYGRSHSRRSGSRIKRTN